MPWEKNFKESDVIDQVMQVFWDKGYAATSISDITTATGVKRGSLYNAFDGKRELFLRSLLKYDQEQRQKLLRRLGEIDNPCDAITQFFDYIVENSQTDPEKRGCMLVNTALDYAHHDTQVQKAVTAAFEELTAFFEGQIERGQRRGDIPQTLEPGPTARTLVALLAGIRVMGRGTFGNEGLQQIADQAKRLIS